MEHRKLGQTDIDVSVICLGCWAFAGGGYWGEQAEADTIAAVHAALDAGVNFFDTAEIYGGGTSEAVLGKALAGRRDEVVIASKVWSAHLAADQVKPHCEKSLRLLNTDRIDLYQIHWPDPDVPVAETLGAMEDLKTEGKVRAIGVSNFGVSYMAEALQAGRIVSNQLNYSLLWRAIEHEVQPMCVREGIGILAYSPLAQGMLTGKYATADDVPAGRTSTRFFSSKRPRAKHGEPGCEEQVFAALGRIREICKGLGEPMGAVALAWVAAQEGVTSVIAGARNAQQAAQNARAAGIQLSDDVLAGLDRATDEVKAYVGTNADMWSSASRMEK